MHYNPKNGCQKNSFTILQFQNIRALQASDENRRAVWYESKYHTQLDISSWKLVLKFLESKKEIFKVSNEKHK